MSKKSILCFTLLFAVAMAGAGFAQSSLTSAARAAAGVDPESGTPVRTPGPQATHAIPTDLIEDDGGDAGASSIKGNPGGLPGIISVPNFTRSFTFNGTEFPYTMVGNDPSLGHKTEIPTKIFAVSLNLLNADGSLQANVPVGEFEDLTLDSPNFQEFKYEQQGPPVQFTDAVQRAEFFSVMKNNSWHTELRPNTIVDRLTINVPRTVTVIRRINGVLTPIQARTYFTGLAPDGHRFVLLLNLFFNQQLNIIMNNEIDAGNATTGAFNTFLLPNTFLFSLGANPGVAPGGCCTLGFHTVFFENTVPTPLWVTIFASWVSPDLFGGGTADVTPLSHEITEAMNDPFGSNIVPRWQFPGIPGACQNNLETGDPVEVLANTVFPVTLKHNGQDFTYHPQTEALLQWFAHTVPSDAIHGAYSYPDLTALTGPSTLCH
jgi:hypothetical protein